MVQAIVEITVNQGIDPGKAVLVGGGGAAGLNSVMIARRLRSPSLLIPEVGAALSAAGAMMSDLAAHFRAHCFTTSEAFDFAGVNAVLAGLDARCRSFLAGPGHGARSHSVTFKAEARYAEQVWDIEIPVAGSRFGGDADLQRLTAEFHRVHEQIFAVSDRRANIEFVGWSAAVAARIRGDREMILAAPADRGREGSRLAYFPGHGKLATAVRRFEFLPAGEIVAGPAIIESSFTTVVVDPGAAALRRPSGSLAIDPGDG
jgi:N-methylhydantoinase A